MRSKLVSSGIRLILLGFLFLIVFYGSHFHISFDYPHRGFFDNHYIRLAKVCLLLLLSMELVRMYYYGVIKRPNGSKVVANVATLFVFPFLLLVALEIVFMFVAQSHEGNITLASHIWFERHWGNMTPDDYRDSPKTDTTGKTKVLIVGDSFTAGHGLSSADERYGNILAEKLGSHYVVYNLGLSGSDTRDEYARLTRFGVTPDVLVLQYFPNDIEKVAAQQGLTPAAFEPYSDLPRSLRSLFMRSYLLNYLYWRFPHGNFAPFDTYARTAYNTPAIINAHLADLNQFIDYAQQHHARLYVVLFPFSHALEKSAEYTKPVVSFFRQHNVPVLDAGKLMADLQPNDRVVGRNDGHASALVNRRVGDALARLMQPAVANKVP